MKSLLTLAAAAFVALSSVHASPPSPGADLNKVIHQATKEGKMGFILMGREACANCKATRQMIQNGSVPVTDDTFVMADINVDDARVSAGFRQRFSREKFGNTLPFVVITDAKGKAFASYGGYKSPKELTALIEEAKAKIEAKAKKP